MKTHASSGLSLVVLATMAMLAFAANSLLCRMALTQSDISPGMFTALRLTTGAVTLLLFTTASRKASYSAGSWLGAIALFVYAAAFSYAYVGMSTGTGALLLFGAVQLTMISVGIARGERFSMLQITGFLLAILGLVILMMPGVTSPAPVPAILMITAGIAWGGYSLMGKNAVSGLSVTAGNFVRALPLVVLLMIGLLFTDSVSWDLKGATLAIASGALASGVGYAIWYLVLPAIPATIAATLQLSVPVIAALAGWMLLSEAITLQMLLASLSILGGIALVIHYRRR